MTSVIDTDEHPRADTSVESLGKLKPILLQTGSGGHRHGGQRQRAERRGVDVHRHHAGEGRRAGAEAAGAAGVLGRRGSAARTSWASARCPRPSWRLAKAGLTLADIDLIELNEAFAAQALAVMREWKFTATDLERTNVQGSGISLGHPVGATGGRMLATLAREMHRRDGAIRAGDHVHRRRPGAGRRRSRRVDRHDQTRADRRADRRPDRDRRHGAAIRGQGGHPERAGARARRHLPAAHRRPDARDGPVRADDPRGVRRARGVAADLRAVRRGAGARLDERVRRHQHALHRRVHDPPARHRRAEAAVPAADGDRRGARRVLDVGAGAGFRRRGHPHQGRSQSRRRLHDHRSEDVADQRRQLHSGGGAGEDRRGRRQAAPQPDGVPRREARRASARCCPA